MEFSYFLWATTFYDQRNFHSKTFPYRFWALLLSPEKSIDKFLFLFERNFYHFIPPFWSYSDIWSIPSERTLEFLRSFLFWDFLGALYGWTMDFYNWFCIFFVQKVRTLIVLNHSRHKFKSLKHSSFKVFFQSTSKGNFLKFYNFCLHSKCDK